MSTEIAVSRQRAAPDHPWWTSAVVYQIYPRSFADGNGDGIGDLPGVLEHVDHLVELGVDVVWLSPVYCSPGDDNGYDISDYQDIDPVFGSLADLDALIAALHARGMTLVMDLVVNHTSDEHPWFVDSRSGLHAAKRDWYIWRPARPGTVAGEPGAEPNNWSSFFSGPAWQYDPGTGEYFLHLFSTKQPDLNWENPDVRRAVHVMMRWWLDRGVDGFRMDVINLLSKHPDLPEAPVRPGETLGDGFPFYGYGPRIHEFLHEMRREVFGGRPGAFLTVGETPGATVEQARRYTDADRGELDMVFHFEHVGIDHGAGGKFEPVPFRVERLAEVFRRWQEGMADRGWLSLYWNNHDQPRVVSRFGDAGLFWRESATALATVLHLQRGTPYIYQGEEIGMTNMPFGSIDDFRDIESLRHYQDATERRGLGTATVLAGLRAMSRDNARTPMQWSADANGGFSSATPWIAVNPNADRINVAAQRGVDGSVLEHYKALIRLRHHLPVVAQGDFSMIDGSPGTVIAFLRRHEGSEMLVAANLGGTDVAFRPPGWQNAELLLSNYPDHSVETLRPWEAMVLLRRPSS